MRYSSRPVMAALTYITVFPQLSNTTISNHQPHPLTYCLHPPYTHVPLSSPPHHHISIVSSSSLQSSPCSSATHLSPRFPWYPNPVHCCDKLVAFNFSPAWKLHVTLNRRQLAETRESDIKWGSYWNNDTLTNSPTKLSRLVTAWWSVQSVSKDDGR